MIERIRTKLAAFPPYDWEDDVKALLEALADDISLMQEMERVIIAARRAVSGPDAESYAQLAGALDHYDRAKVARDKTR